MSHRNPGLALLLGVVLLAAQAMPAWAYDGAVPFPGNADTPAQIEVGNVTLQVGLAGWVVTKDVKVPPEGTFFTVNWAAKQVSFGVTYRFINQRMVFSQKFSVGLTIRSLKDDGTVNQTLYNNTRMVFPEVGANGQKSGFALSPAYNLGNGKFKITVHWDIYGVECGSKTFTCTVQRGPQE